MAEVPESGFRKYWRQKLSSLKSQYHDITNKYPETASVMQQVYKVIRAIEILAKYTTAKVGENSEWTITVNNEEESRANFCEILDGKPIFRALYGMNTVTLNELKAALKVSAQEGHSGGVNKTSVESTAQNDIRELFSHEILPGEK
jgi:hypothetical protein